MRALQVISVLATRTGGVAAGVVQAAVALREQGIHSSIFATDGSSTSAVAARRPVTTAELPAGSDDLDIRLFKGRPPRRFSYSPELRSTLKNEVASFDVIHIHSLFLYPQWSAYKAAKESGVPYVVSPHGALDPYLRRRGRARKAVTTYLWQKSMLEGASALVFGADDEAELAGDIAPSVRRVVIPNAIDLDAYASLPSDVGFRARRLNQHNGPVVLFLGRLAAKKGLDLLIRSFAVVAQQRPDAILVIAGPDDEGLRGELTRLAEMEGIQHQIFFTGMLHGDEKFEALGAADVWVLSSYSDACAVAAAEALAAGLPVVVSQAVNLASDIDREGAGIVCDLDPDAFATAIVELLRDIDCRANLGARARVFAQRFGRPGIGRDLASLYSEVIRL